MAWLPHWEAREAKERIFTIMFVTGFINRLRGHADRRAGNNARDRKGWSEAAAAYARYLERVPNDFAIWVQLGHVRKESGDLRGAHRAYSHALALKPNNADLLLNFGRLHRMRGNKISAIDMLSRSYRLDPARLAEAELKELLGQSGWQGQLHHKGLDGEFEQDKILASGLFDPNWYATAHPEIGNQPALEHFCKQGAFEGKSPGPHFDTGWYLSQNPDLIPGVSAGILNPLLHFLDHGRREGRTALPPPGTNEAVRTLVESIFDIDPEIYAVERFANADSLKSLRILGGIPNTPDFLAFKRVFDALAKPYDYIIAIPWLTHGGADLVALHIARAIVELAGKDSVLLIACDFANSAGKDWLPAGVDFVMLQDEQETLSIDERVEALSYLLQAIQPQAVINVNSQACWDLFKRRGKPLSQLMRLYGCAFCRDYSSDDRAAGYADTHLRESLPWLSGLISDNASFFDVLSEHFCLPASFRPRFVKLYNPAPEIHALPALPPADCKVRASPKASPFKVLWASRMARQKNLPLLEQIAINAPDIHFDIWGRGPEEEAVRKWAAELDNVAFRGPYPSFDRLPLADYQAFLYTSLWDGIPNVLLEAAAAGLPLVASQVGGICELVDDETGWLIENVEDPASYVSALRQIRNDEATLKRRQGNMAKRLVSQHNWAAFKQVLVDSAIVRSA